MYMQSLDVTRLLLMVKTYYTGINKIYCLLIQCVLKTGIKVKSWVKKLKWV
jgi:hypothetical protein